jgi:hypothetical protein
MAAIEANVGDPIARAARETRFEVLDVEIRRQQGLRVVAEGARSCRGEGTKGAPYPMNRVL